MGIVTGITQDKLNLIKTYDPSQPYIVGRNGVTAVYTDSDGVKNIKYTIGSIDYHTKLIKEFTNPRRPIGVETAPNLNTIFSSTRSYLPSRDVNTSGRRKIIGPSQPPDIVNPTTFRYTTQQKQETDYFVFKDEAKMGVVFQPKVLEEVFIERESISIFESQARLGEIISLEGLTEYNNGFYNITKLE